MFFWPRKDPVPPLPAGIAPALYRLTAPGLPDELVGYLSVAPDHIYSVEGPWWNSRWVRPRLCGDWLVDYGDFDTYKVWPNGAAAYGQDDGFPLEAEELHALAHGVFLLRGIAFRADEVDARTRPGVWNRHYALVPEPSKQGCRAKGVR